MKYPVKVEKKEHWPFALSYMPARLRAMRIITSSHTFIADEKHGDHIYVLFKKDISVRLSLNRTENGVEEIVEDV